MGKGKSKGRRSQPLDQWPRLRDELLALTAELGHFPSLSDLERRGRYDIMRAFVHHGGTAAVERRLTTEAEAVAAEVLPSR